MSTVTHFAAAAIIAFTMLSIWISIKKSVYSELGYSLAKPIDHFLVNVISAVPPLMLGLCIYHLGARL